MLIIFLQPNVSSAITVIRQFKSAVGYLTRYLRRLDGDATFLFIFPCVCETGLSSTSWGNDASLRHKRVGQSWLSVIYVRNHRHVTDVGLLVHDGTDLVDCEVHLGWQKSHQNSHKKQKCTCSKKGLSEKTGCSSTLCQLPMFIIMYTYVSVCIQLQLI